MGQTRSFGDVCLMSGLPLESGLKSDIVRWPLRADFVAEVAEEESGRWRRAINLACPSPVRAVPGDSPNDCQRDFGMT